MKPRTRTALLVALGAIASVALVVLGLVLSGLPTYGPRAWIFVALALGVIWWDIAYHVRTARSGSGAESRRVRGPD